MEKSAFEKAMEQTGLPFFGSGFGYFEPYPPPISPAIERAMERTCLPFFGSSFRLFAPDMPSKSSSIESVTEPMTPLFSRSFAAHSPSKSSSIVMLPQNPIPTLSRLREICDEDYCEQIPRDVIGASITFRNACEYGFLIKERAELALKFYNDGQGKNFKLHRVCKANKVANVFYGRTFEAKEGENEDCLVFRGVVHLLGGDHAVYCEIKDDEIKLGPADDDYVSSESDHLKKT